MDQSGRLIPVLSCSPSSTGRNRRLAPVSTLIFDERMSCITCASTQFSSAWSATYNDLDVQKYMDLYGYAVDWRSELEGKPISLVACAACETLFHQHILQPDSLERLYSDWIDEDQIDTLSGNLESPLDSETQFQTASENVRHLLRLNRILGGDRDKQPPWRVLDFGCGAAEFLKQASLFGFETWGVDFSTTRKAQALHNQISIIASLEAYKEVAHAPVHAITLFQVLEHLDRPRRTLIELASVLAADGILIVEVPHCASGRGKPRSFEEFRNVHPLEHINAFTPETLTTLVESAGFTKIKPGPPHVTSHPGALGRSELTRFYEPKRTKQYFRKGSTPPA